MTRRARFVVLISAVAIWLAGCLLTAPGAQAHAELTGSSPADGARLSAVPSQVTLTFSEGIAIRDCAVRVAGHDLPIHQPSGQPNVLVADLSGTKAADGRLRLDWRSVAADDGHTVSGSISFLIPAAGNTPPAAAASTAMTVSAGVPGPDPAVRRALIAAQFLGFLSMALFIGGLAFIAFAWPQGGAVPRIRRALSIAWLLGLAATVAQAGAQAADAALLPLTGAFNGTAVQNLLATRLGTALLARALLWLLAGVVLVGLLQRQERAARSPAWWVGLISVAFGLLRTASMPGHDDTAHPLAGAIAGTVHLAGVSLWIGGLLTLLFGVLPRRKPEEMAVAVARYSNLALISMLAIIGAGTLMAWQLVGSLHALLHTGYGHTLLLKLALVATVVALAQRSKAWVRHRLDVAVLLDGDRATVRPLVYSVAAEAGLALAILAAASVLVTSSPGR